MTSILLILKSMSANFVISFLLGKYVVECYKRRYSTGDKVQKKKSYKHGSYIIQKMCYTQHHKMKWLTDYQILKKYSVECWGPKQIGPKLLPPRAHAGLIPIGTIARAGLLNKAIYWPHITSPSMI
jgi:hypothetical protein